jgi:hypothetical protein
MRSGPPCLCTGSETGQLTMTAEYAECSMQYSAVQYAVQCSPVCSTVQCHLNVGG